MNVILIIFEVLLIMASVISAVAASVGVIAPLTYLRKESNETKILFYISSVIGIFVSAIFTYVLLKLHTGDLKILMIKG